MEQLPHGEVSPGAPLTGSTPSAVAQLFAPPGIPWQRLSKKFLTLKFITIPVTWIVIFAAAGFAYHQFLPEWPLWPVIAFAIIWIAWRLFRAPRVWRNWGYAERELDIYLTYGLFNRTLQCVPYGRMQLVEVQSGPLARLFGLASVEMVTSSTSGTVTIPGLAAEEAAALRDRLIAHGEAQQAGI